MAATQRRKRPKVLLDGPASAAALKQPASGLLHRALGERITLVVSQAIIEELAHHLGPERQGRNLRTPTSPRLSRMTPGPRGPAPASAVA